MEIKRSETAREGKISKYPTIADEDLEKVRFSNKISVIDTSGNFGMVSSLPLLVNFDVGPICIWHVCTRTEFIWEILNLFKNIIAYFLLLKKHGVEGGTKII